MDTEAIKKMNAEIVDLHFIGRRKEAQN